MMFTEDKKKKSVKINSLPAVINRDHLSSWSGYLNSKFCINPIKGKSSTDRKTEIDLFHSMIKEHVTL